VATISVLAVVIIVFVFRIHKRGSNGPQWTLSLATLRHLKNLAKATFVNLQIITFMPTVLGVSFPAPFSELLAVLDFFTLGKLLRLVGK